MKTLSFAWGSQIFAAIVLFNLSIEGAQPASPSQTTGVQTQSVSAAQFSGEVLPATGTNVPVMVSMPQATAGGLYVQNRSPLLPAPFMKLPIGAIQPRGWLLHQLELEAKGMVG